MTEFDPKRSSHVDWINYGDSNEHADELDRTPERITSASPKLSQWASALSCRSKSSPFERLSRYCIWIGK